MFPPLLCHIRLNLLRQKSSENRGEVKRKPLEAHLPRSVTIKGASSPLEARQVNVHFTAGKESNAQKKEEASFWVVFPFSNKNSKSNLFLFHVFLDSWSDGVWQMRQPMWKIFWFSSKNCRSPASISGKKAIS